MRHVGNIPELRDRRRIREILYSRVLIGVLVVLIVLALNAVFNIHAKYRETETNKLEALYELDKLMERGRGLKRDIVRLETPRGVEEEIRKQLGLAKAGEGVIVVFESLENTDRKFLFENQDILDSIWAVVKNIFKNN